jgi:hypothetical protein
MPELVGSDASRSHSVNPRDEVTHGDSMFVAHASIIKRRKYAISVIQRIDGLPPTPQNQPFWWNRRIMLGTMLFISLESDLSIPTASAIPLSRQTLINKSLQFFPCLSKPIARNHAMIRACLSANCKILFNSVITE